MSIVKSVRNLLALGDALASRGYNLEDPNTPLGAALGAVPSSPSGVSVTADSAMRISAFLACVRVIAEGIGTLPVHVYRRDSSGGKARDRGHPVYSLLHDRPNPFMTAIVWKELVAKQVITKGNHYSEIEFDEWGYPVALWPLNPDTTWPEVGADGVLRYKTAARGQGRILAAGQVFHVKGLTEDGIEGVALIRYGRDTLGIAAAADRFSGRFFAQGANPSGVLSSAKPLGKDGRQRLAEAWREAYSGLDNAFRVVVLEDGLTWAKTTIDPADAQLIEAKKYSRSEIESIFRVPPHLIGDTEKATSWGSGIEEQNIGFVSFTLMPWLVRIEQEANSKLFTDRERGTFFAEFSADAFLRGSMKNRADALAVMRQNGVLNGDEWRALENMNPIADGSGAVYMANGNMRPVLQLAADPAAPAAAGARGALLVVARDAFERIAARAGKDIRKAGSRAGTAAALSDAVRGELNGAWAVAVLMPIARAAAAAAGADADVGKNAAAVMDFLTGFAKDFAGSAARADDHDLEAAADRIACDIEARAVTDADEFLDHLEWFKSKEAEHADHE